MDKYGNIVESAAMLQNNDNMSNADSERNVHVDSADMNISASDQINVIISNQQVLAKKLIKLEKGLQEVFTSVQNICSMISNNPAYSNSRPASALSLISNVSVDVPVEYSLISDENELETFEKSIEDQGIRKKLIEHFVTLIGLKSDGGKTVSRSIALQLDRKMFKDSFWRTTAWTGGRKVDGPKKFVFAAHTTLISFMNDVIRHLCGAPLSDSEFADFVKSRTRNSGYVRTSTRQTAARTPRASKEKKSENANNHDILNNDNTGIVPPVTDENVNVENSKENEEKEANVG